MKKVAVPFLVVMMVILITIGCGKTNDDNDDPVEKKKHAWVSGDQDSTGYGMILFSADGGDTWVRQGMGSSALLGIDIQDIWAIDENNVWAIGSNNAILRTINGGQTWTRVQAPVNTANPVLMSISIVNKTNIWISGANGTVYNSTDNGGTWTMFDTAVFHNAALQGIWAISPEKVYVVGQSGDVAGRGFIGYTLDGGVTWDSVTPAEDYNQHEWIGVTASGNTIVVYGGKAHYVVSTDGGTTWENGYVPHTGGESGADINHLIMLNSQTWWGAFDEGQIFITSDGGTSWTLQQTGQGGYFMVGIDAWDSQLAIAVGAPLSMPIQSPIIKTGNGGTSWEKKYTCNTTLWKVTFIKD